MALANLPCAIAWPGVTRLGSGSAIATAAGSSLTAAGHYDGFVFCAPQDFTLTHIGWRPNTVTGSPTADVRVETVAAATGLPSGTLWAANTNIVTGTLTAAWRLDALTASASITKGQMVAIKFGYNSGTNFAARVMTNYTTSNSVPYRVTNTGTPAKASLTNCFNAALGTSSTTFIPLLSVNPVVTINNNTFGNPSSAARGNRFQVPFKCRAVGLRAVSGTAAGDVNAVLYDDSGTELSSSSTAFDGDYHFGGAGTALEYFFDNAVTLSPGTWYRMALEPTTITLVNQTVFNLSTADYRSAMPGGTNFYYATRASGTWTDTPTSVCIMDLLIGQLDDGAGGGMSRAKAFGGFA